MTYLAVLCLELSKPLDRINTGVNSEVTTTMRSLSVALWKEAEPPQMALENNISDIIYNIQLTPQALLELKLFLFRYTHFYKCFYHFLFFLKLDESTPGPGGRRTLAMGSRTLKP